MSILKDIFTYAYRGNGKYILVICAVLSVVAELLHFVPFAGAILYSLLGGYFCATYFHIIQSSASGEKDAPDFPDMTNIYEDIIGPMMQIVGVAVVSFGPFVGYMMWVGDDSFNSLIGYGLLGFGVIYFPMAMLAVVVLGGIEYLSPHIVIPSILRGGWLYWFGVLLLGFLYATGWLISTHLSDRPIIGVFVISIVGAYVLMTSARILGIVYREREDKLRWA